jgi:sugar phosphate isomerase/epimerase
VRTQPDAGLLVGMSVVLMRDDLETAVRSLGALGFEAIEVHAAQLGPGMPGVPVLERHAEAAGDLVRAYGLHVSTLNAVADSSFDPFGGTDAFERTVAGLAAHLRLAAAMGAPRVLIYEGRVEDAAGVSEACGTLGRCLDQARRRSGLTNPPAISVELHPFTFGLRHRRLADLGRVLSDHGAGICVDFCHFGVALGRDFVAHLDDEVLAATNHVHVSDTDCTTSELHFPLGRGTLDLDAIGARLRGRGLAMSWDLFGWPGPRRAVEEYMPRYREFVERYGRTSG